MTYFKCALLVSSLMLSINVFAHGKITETYPRDGDMLMSQAERVELNFEEPMKVISLKVENYAGKEIEVTFDRNAPETKKFKAMLPKLRPDNYFVEWRAIGKDGHTVKGKYGFMQH